MRFGCFFSGIGGFSYGFASAGHELRWMCENEERCRAVLSSNFPGITVLGDVREVTAFPEPLVDIIVAGFPCQDVSERNLGRGDASWGSRSSLVEHVFRLLESQPVPIVILENVRGLLVGNAERNILPFMDHVACRLEELGYNWAYRVVHCGAFGSPQSRERVYVVAARHGDPRDILLASTAKCGGRCRPRCFRCLSDVDWWVTPLNEAMPHVELGCVPTATRTNSNRLFAVPLTQSTEGQHGGMLRVAAVERLQGFPQGWTEPAVLENSRYKALGNAVHVSAAAWMGRCVRDSYHFKYAHGGDRELPQRAPHWPLAAWYIKGVGRRRADALLDTGLCLFPLALPVTPIGDIVRLSGGLKVEDARERVKDWLARKPVGSEASHRDRFSRVPFLALEVMRAWAGRGRQTVLETMARDAGLGVRLSEAVWERLRKLAVGHFPWVNGQSRCVTGSLHFGTFVEQCVVKRAGSRTATPTALLSAYKKWCVMHPAKEGAAVKSVKEVSLIAGEHGLRWTQARYSPRAFLELAIVVG